MSDIDWPVQSQKQARRLKIRIQEEVGLYYLCCNENKGADQLRSYCAAGLRLWVRLCILLIFLCSGSIMFLLSRKVEMPQNIIF